MQEVTFCTTIRVKYLGATTYRHSRYKASFADEARDWPCMTEPCDHGRPNGAQAQELALRLLTQQIERFWNEKGKKAIVDVTFIGQSEIWSDSYAFHIAYDFHIEREAE